MAAASVHRSGEKLAIRRMRPGVRGQRSAEVEPAKPLERCAFFCRTVRWETLHLKAMAESEGEALNSLFETLADWEHQIKKAGVRVEELRP
jgi:hypothetical protein